MASGVAWSFTEKLLSMVIQMVVSIVVARALMPADFGVMAILTFFTSVALTLADRGSPHTVTRQAEAIRPEAVTRQVEAAVMVATTSSTIEQFRS